MQPKSRKEKSCNKSTGKNLRVTKDKPLWEVEEGLPSPEDSIALGTCPGSQLGGKKEITGSKV